MDKCERLSLACFRGITTKIDDNVDILRAKLENTSIIFLQLKLSNKKPFFEKGFHEIFTAGRKILCFCEL